ncbi:hypothetical protein [Fulvivirga sediminis]|uniref:Zinc-finger domain-containing protein n=1 Tax=Fulvivirga sediminis TaxID=2803949 RepID=A0A937F7C2_9BACT|nr:hypothetical protein [Fulvivirga sediminis]MBL3656356.1 hypothetical protein [Fulvivirga sediminis]
MKEPAKISDELLLDYIDGNLSHTDRLIIEEACKHSPWKERLKELSLLNSSLLSLHETWSEPDEAFNVGIMKNIYAYDMAPKISRKYIILLSALLFTCIIGCISLPSLPASYINQLPTIQYYINQLNISALQNSLSINIQFVIEGSLFVCALLSLILIDRIILKPFFLKRKTDSMH